MRLLPCGVLATRFQKNNGIIHIFRASKRTFRVEVRKPQEEIDREEAREIEERKRQNLRDKVERMYAEKRQALEKAPKNPGDFLKKKSRKIQDFMEDIHNLFMRAENGFHYAPEIVEEARDLIADLVSLAANGRVCFDPIRQKYFLDDIEEKFEKANPEFSVFMKATLAVGKAAL
jgi:signal recognition particle GTPase